jgi:DNA-binding GntR family transcriptional regulator
MHRRIYQAIRSRNVDQARELMNEHLQHSAAFQAEEPPARPVARPTQPVARKRPRPATH